MVNQMPNMTTRGIMMDAEMWGLVQRISKARRISASDIVRVATAEWLIRGGYVQKERINKSGRFMDPALEPQPVTVNATPLPGVFPSITPPMSQLGNYQDHNDPYASLPPDAELSYDKSMWRSPSNPHWQWVKPREA